MLLPVMVLLPLLLLLALLLAMLLLLLASSGSQLLLWSLPLTLLTAMGGNNTPAPIGKAGQICRMNFQPIAIKQIFFGSPLALPIQKVN
jgi:hypothetical protein